MLVNDIKEAIEGATYGDYKQDSMMVTYDDPNPNMAAGI